MLSLPPTKRNALLQGLPDNILPTILHDWGLWARDNQLPPVDRAWFIWMIISGRGYGKTRAELELVIKWAREGYTPIAIVGQTAADGRDTLVEIGDSALLNISPPDFMPVYESSKRRLTWPNGVVGILYYGDEPGQLRGPQHQKAIVDELAKYKYPQATWDNLMFGLRIGDNPQVAVATTPRPIPIIKQLVRDSKLPNPDVVISRGHTMENKANLSPHFLKYIIGKYEGTRTGRQELAGEILDDNPEALWRRDWIEDNRVVEHPPLIRIIVAIDPQAKKGTKVTKETGAVTEEAMSETGITVTGRDKNNNGYLLADYTLNGTPDEWGAAAVTAFFMHNADLIVGEVNNGGEMVGHVIKTVLDPHGVPYGERLPYMMVHASRGKQVRAEPVSVIYKQGRLHHVGCSHELGDQLREWVPGDDSPDRLDSLVWGATELFPMLPPESIHVYDPLPEVMAGIDIG